MDTFTQEFRVEGEVMHVRLGGSFPHERLSSEQNLFQPLIDACVKDHCRMAVVDARELQVDFNTMELFRAGVDVSRLNQIGLRLALVARSDMLSPFFDDVIRNRVAPVHVFTDLESASAWLNGST